MANSMSFQRDPYLLMDAELYIRTKLGNKDRYTEKDLKSIGLPMTADCPGCGVIMPIGATLLLCSDGHATPWCHECGNKENDKGRKATK